MDYSTSKEYPNLHVISDKHLLTLSNEKTSHTCRIVNFTSLDKIDAKVLLTIYRQTTTSHPTVIHCDFGVGLTGQMRLIFKALDLMETDHYFRQVFDKLSQSIPIKRAEQKYMDDKIIDLVCKLRKIRYAFEEESQAKGAVDQLVKLHAARSRPSIKEIFRFHGVGCCKIDCYSYT